MHRVVVSSTFQAQFQALPRSIQQRLRRALEALAMDPLTPRPGADIKHLKATEPPKWRLRVGQYRIVYFVHGREVRVIEVFARERGYRE